MVHTIPLGNDPEAATKIADQIEQRNSKTTPGFIAKDNDGDNFANDETESILSAPNLQYLPGPPSLSSIPSDVGMPEKSKGSASKNPPMEGTELLSREELMPNQEQYPVVVPKLKNYSGIPVTTIMVGFLAGFLFLSFFTIFESDNCGEECNIIVRFIFVSIIALIVIVKKSAVAAAMKLQRKAI
eukprot:CAMPEP_0172380228 /NCGR_PEP_ID=MMETSP1060-20121228/70331_1 /TAXON_ID=37318 /ORGANISM="Pseudo-nitzschia pungens, Strain cf. cingulata" /LENGTH=184 /DNA_ID=CAMNT_0013107979 /DNA_START=500 /DNA_END=1055 /DNA_ORIENTATION=+